MATPADFQNDFLTCTICYEIYTTPKTLPCLHTFCQRCLSSYIEAEDETFGVRRKQAFPCPLCRALAKPPVPNKPLHTWAAAFKTNFFMENLMSSLKVKGTSAEQTTQYEKMLSSVASSKSSDNISRLSERSPQSSTYTVRDTWSAFETEDVDALPYSAHSWDSNINSGDNVCIEHLSAPPNRKTYEHIKTLSASMPDDTTSRRSKLCGICVVDNIVVVIDFESNCIKTFFNWRARLDVNIVSRSLDLPDKPRSLTKIKDSEVAVTLPSRGAFCFIKLTPFLRVRSIVSTARKYKCIANSGSRSLIALTSRTLRISPIDIVNYDGITLKTVDISSELIGLDFAHISVSNSGLVHLVDAYNNAIYCITQDGFELYCYQQRKEGYPFESLNGLCCPFSDVYITDFDANAVFEIKSDSSLPVTRERILSSLDGIKKPTDVHVEPDGTVFVACWDGNVRVYSLKQSRSILKKPEETAV